MTGPRITQHTYTMTAGNKFCVISFFILRLQLIAISFSFSLVSLAGAFIARQFECFDVRYWWRDMLCAYLTHIYIESAFGFFASRSFILWGEHFFFLLHPNDTFLWSRKMRPTHERKSKGNWRKEFLSFFFFCFSLLLQLSIEKFYRAHDGEQVPKRTPHTGSGIHTQHTLDKRNLEIDANKLNFVRKLHEQCEKVSNFFSRCALSPRSMCENRKI